MENTSDSLIKKLEREIGRLREENALLKSTTRAQDKKLSEYKRMGKYIDAERESVEYEASILRARLKDIKHVLVEHIGANVTEDTDSVAHLAVAEIDRLRKERDEARSEAKLNWGKYEAAVGRINEAHAACAKALKERDALRDECAKLKETLGKDGCTLMAERYGARSACDAMRSVVDAARYVINAQDESELLEAERKVAEAFRAYDMPSE